jgi:hypothetical protein
VPRRHQQLSAVVASIAVVLLAACGEGRLSKSGYEQKVRSAYEDVRAAFRQTNVGFDKLPTKIAAAQAQLREAADELEEAKSPQEVEKQNEELVEALRAFADDLDGLRKAAERRDAAAVAAFNEGLPQSKEIERIREAAEEIRAKGYDLGPIGKD